jgi:hypothetical protein
MTKAALRAVVLICLGVGILFFMHREGLFDLSAVASAFAQQLPLVVVIVLSQILLAGLLLLRYGLLVRMLGLTLPWSHLASANFVSNAVGQWAPGSLAVTEILRMSLMLGAQKAQGNSLSKSASAIAVASFYDRTIGFFTMLSVGSVTTLIALWQGVRSQALVPSFQNASFVGLGALFVFSFFSSLGLLCRILTKEVSSPSCTRQNTRSISQCAGSAAARRESVASYVFALSDFSTVFVSVVLWPLFVRTCSGWAARIWGYSGDLSHDCSGQLAPSRFCWTRRLSARGSWSFWALWSGSCGGEHC